MTGYATKPWSDRFGVMGVQAEAAFEDWAGPRVIQRLGYDRSPLPHSALLQLPLWLRHLPDYILFDEGLTYLVEVVGTANPQGFKVRETKRMALEFIAENGGHPHFFIYNSVQDAYRFLSFKEVKQRSGPVDHFSDGNAFRFVENTIWVPMPR